MSDFKAKMYQIQFWLGLGELTALPRPPSWIKGPTSKGRGQGKGSLGRGGDETPPLHAPQSIFLDMPLFIAMSVKHCIANALVLGPEVFIKLSMVVIES